MNDFSKDIFYIATYYNKLYKIEYIDFDGHKYQYISLYDTKEIRRLCLDWEVLKQNSIRLNKIWSEFLYLLGGYE